MKSSSSFTAGLAAGVVITLALGAGTFAFLSLSGRNFCPLLPKKSLASPPVPSRAAVKTDYTSPVRGSEAAPVTIEEFADFHCGFCKKAEPILKQVLADNAGKVRLVFRHFPLSHTPGSGSYLTHEASVCAQEQGKFWEFHDAVFSFSAVPQEADLYTLAGTIGLDMSRFESCVKSGRVRNFIENEMDKAQEKGVSGTPTAFINGRRAVGALPYERWKKLIEDATNPDSAFNSGDGRVRFKNLDGRPSEGLADAPILLVEFGDYHCPFCHKLQPTLQRLMAGFPGKIRHVFRHYPLPFHTGAELTHQASECAHEQGKFWEYHRSLFTFSGGVPDAAALSGLAKQTGLDEKKFESCLSSGKYLELVRKDAAKGQEAGVEGTPAVFVNGELVSGAQPYERFEKLVQKELEKNKSLSP